MKFLPLEVTVTIPVNTHIEHRPLSVILDSPVAPLDSWDGPEILITPGPSTIDIDFEPARDTEPPVPGRSLESSGGQTRPSDTSIDWTTFNVISSLDSSSAVITKLEARGCVNLSNRLNLETCSQHPVYRGGYGDVYSCYLHNRTKVAIKTLRPYESDNLPAGRYQKRIAKELYTWSKCSHPNVTKLLGFVEFQGYLAMVSVWAENGNILSYVRKHPTADRCLLSALVCEGLVYLHANNIVHGNLQGANVLVSGDGTPMLTDFGEASLSESTISFTATGANRLSFRWAAPEIIEGSSQHRAGDVYALGMTILEIITGQVPFSGIKQDMHIARIVVDKKETPPRPKEIPAQSAYGNTLWELLMRCWNRQPELRPSAAQVRDTVTILTPETLAHGGPST